MSVGTDTTDHENGGIVSIVTPMAAGCENWIPAYAGMTMWWPALVVTGGVQTRPYECRLAGGYLSEV